MNESQIIRLEAMKLALEFNQGLTKEKLIEVAKLFEVYLKG